MINRIKRFFEFKRKNIKVWKPCNIYMSAKIGENVSIGRFTEIGHNVKIGDNVRIGAMSFIPEGVTIEDDVFVGPHSVFTNDKFPPSGRENWLKTKVKKGASIGAGATIICGVVINEKALIGAGSVVTKDVPVGATFIGVPARDINEKKKVKKK